MKKILVSSLLFVSFIIFSTDITFGAESVYPQKQVYPQESVYPQENVYKQDNPYAQEEDCGYNKWMEIEKKCAEVLEEESAKCKGYCYYTKYNACIGEANTARNNYIECDKERLLKGNKAGNENCDGYISIEGSTKKCMPKEACNGYIQINGTQKLCMPEENCDGYISIEGSTKKCVSKEECNGYILIEGSTKKCMPNPTNEWVNPYNFWENPFKYLWSAFTHWLSSLFGWGDSGDNQKISTPSSNKKVIVRDGETPSVPAPTTAEPTSVPGSTPETVTEPTSTTSQDWSASQEAITQTQNISPSLSPSASVPTGLPVTLNTFPCIGETPANSEICPGDDKNVPYYQEKRLVDSCSIPAGSDPKCEYICQTEHLNDGTCKERGFFWRVLDLFVSLF